MGEFVVPMDPKRRPAIQATPLSPEVGVGALSFGLYLGGNLTLRDELSGDDKTFVFVLDSPTLRFGYVWANLIRRAAL